MTEFIPSTTIDLSAQSNPETRRNPRNRKPTKRVQAQTPVDEPLVNQAIRTWRTRDNRQWSDVEVQEFPSVFFYNLHQEEWKRNEVLSQKLLNYFSFEDTAGLHILDVGSGSGWFAHFLAQKTQAKITGIDLMEDQIQQARKNFRHERLAFKKADFYTGRIRKQSFDHLIFFHSLPWLGSIDKVVERANGLLKSGGSIHILGTSFPTAKKFDKERSSFEEYCADKRMSSILEFFQLTPKSELDRLGFTDMNATNFVSSILGKKSDKGWYLKKKS